MMHTLLLWIAKRYSRAEAMSNGKKKNNELVVLAIVELRWSEGAVS